MDTMTYIWIGIAVVGVLALVLVARFVGRRPRQPDFGVELPDRRSRGGGTLVEERPGKIGDRLGKTSRNLGGALRNVFSRENLDDAFWEEMEEALIAADVGVSASGDIVAAVREARPERPDTARDLLAAELRAILDHPHRELDLVGEPAVIMVVGVNGTGKTTSIAKIARRLGEDGKSVILGAADTFRAAADTQLRTWGNRLGFEVVGGADGSDPASVAFDSYSAARARGRDVLIVDTAGRLHAKANLMAELEKIERVLIKEAGTLDEVLLVLDATSGQNGIAQVEAFVGAVGVTGIVLTKLDGTARGGVVIACERELGVPVKLIGVGEGIDDLIVFDSDEFVTAILADTQ
ncbi:MAG: signal recognition particle-docking protein FtsY [Acidimicrobiia bacterium]|nr:signal recognition particle-docking protein FtsY [Acidimicrobiia bacterium]